MKNKILPVVDQWYRHRDKGQRFFVTAVDPEADSVEVQHFDSDLEEFSMDQWYQLDIEPSEEPENWSGALDLSEKDDCGTEVTDTGMNDWNQPLNEFPGNNRKTAADSNGDDYGEGYMEEESLEDQEPDVAASDQSLAEDGLSRRGDGVVEESFSDIWYAEYTENSDTGLWKVEVFKHDVPQWRNMDFESLDEARAAARNHYDQA